ncbi:MAG: VTT domain-containing protein [Chloroflexota bacterium]|nr:VTT domain-containing protein [Chloroflexota bacterium]
MSGSTIDPFAARPTPRRAWQRWFPVIVTAILVVMAFAAGTWIAADPARVEEMRRLISSPQGLLALFLINVVSSATLILPLPGLALTPLAATVADPLLVGLIAGSGQTIGELTGYLAGYSGRKALGIDARTQRMTSLMRRWGAPILFVLALIPNPFFDVAGIIAGATRMPLRLYLLAAGLGKILKNMALAYGVTLGIDWMFGIFG